ncbi:substrate-binding domain-containing protein [Deinococcus koreensis]|uniref:XRE family transcriptional regulator n=1 Tax=Deinococcus koreensis TaxID=2054903 RepID=A0A2K3UX68_9DEIO|nr:substrate-binding domain-containing protein [Deinococcus koreensis]PNY81120.1 XRE family transcriptional regulator [Deinococcus koreensis]
MTLPPPLRPNVRAMRERSGLGPAQLARRSGITRQALHAIETGATVPSTLTALRLARELRCAVEALFTLTDAEVQARVVGSLDAGHGSRVGLAQVGAELLAFPLAGGALGESADGLAEVADSPEPAQGNLARVTLFGDLEAARRTLVVAGCDPSLGLLAAHVGREASGHRMRWQPQPSLEALRSVARGEAHAAGIHLWEAGTGVSNLPFAERELPGRAAQLFTLWSWEQGLMVAPGNPHGIRGVADLLRPGLRLVNRGEGAGSRLLLDAWLDTLGLSRRARRALSGYGDEAATPLEAAQRVAGGAADVAPGPRSAAQAWGLPFIPVQSERFDLVVPEEHAGHPALRALLSAVTRPAFRAELLSLGGYDPTHAGERWATTQPAPSSPSPRSVP